MIEKARYVMVGGFLGAGKTTGILKMAQILSKRGLKVGLITNDQSIDLVDTRMLASHGFNVEEITGGCFCCKFGSLVEASEKLTEATRPDVFITEPVGSCTDLQATVGLPLQRIYGDKYELGPLSVFVDPLRARRVLGLEQGRKFSSKVLYVYLKQLEEAEILVINKVDLLTTEQFNELKAELEKRYPDKSVIGLSARDEVDLEPWIHALLNDASRATSLAEIDYDIYAEGEAKLGWFNCRVEINAAEDSDDEIDGNQLLFDLARKIQKQLAAHNLEVAHFKMTLSPSEFGGDLGVVNLVRSDAKPELSHSLFDAIESGELLVNLRAEGDPDQVKGIVEEQLNRLASRGQFTHEITRFEHFRPARPVPTHRLSSQEAAS